MVISLPFQTGIFPQLANICALDATAGNAGYDWGVDGSSSLVFVTGGPIATRASAGK
jgi:hypothetical protein